MFDVGYYTEQFHLNGYAHIPSAIGEYELSTLRAATDRIIRCNRPRDRLDTKYCDVIDNEYVDGKTLCRIEYLLDKDPAFIKLLGHPLILAFAASVLQEPFLLTWEDMLVKVPRDGICVPPHQDLLYQSNHGLVFSVGVYLDDSSSSPFELIPGTHRFPALKKAELCALSALNAENFLSLPVRAGDLLVHNVKLIHRSPPNSGDDYRRTAYFEFRTLTSVLTDSPWSSDWAWARLPYVSTAVRERRACAALVASDQSLARGVGQAHARLWELNAMQRAADEINWRVIHDDVLYRRECDLEFE
jgi:hypothetical protein